MSNTLKTVFLFSVIASLLIGIGWTLGGPWPWILGALATGARLAGDPSGLASALSKLEHAATLTPQAQGTPATASLFIVNPLTAGSRVARWFSTHPPTEDRVARLLDR